MADLAKDQYFEKAELKSDKNKTLEHLLGELAVYDDIIGLGYLLKTYKIQAPK